MHELPVTESILEIAQRHAEAAGAAQVTDIFLVIGELSSMVDDSIHVISSEAIEEDQPEEKR